MKKAHTAGSVTKPRPAWLPLLGRTRAGVFVVDARQRIVLWNKGAERLLGHSASQVLHEPCHQVIAGTRDGRTWCHSNCPVQRKLRRGTLPPDVDLLTRTRSGKEVWVNCSILAIPSDGKQLAVHFMRDVTRDKRNEPRLGTALVALSGGGAPPASPRPPSPAAQLTPRELEVLTFLSQGAATSAIAERMGISLLTVRKHVQNALSRLGLHSKVAAVSFALRNGIL